MVKRCSRLVWKSDALKGLENRLISDQLGKRRKILLAGLAMVALLTMGFFYQALNRNTQILNEGLSQKLQTLTETRQKVLDKNPAQRELVRLQNAYKLAERKLLTGRTPSLAAAEIQEILTKIINAAGAQIMTMRILQPDQNDQNIYLAIPVEVAIESTMRELTQLLYQLDSSAKLLRIVKLEIRSRGGSGRRARRERTVNLVATLTVEGFVNKLDT